MIQAVDELIDANRIADATWAILGKTLAQHQLMDLTFTIGHYVMTGWALASFGVPIEVEAEALAVEIRVADQFEDQAGELVGIAQPP